MSVAFAAAGGWPRLRTREGAVGPVTASSSLSPAESPPVAPAGAAFPGALLVTEYCSVNEEVAALLLQFGDADPPPPGARHCVAK